MEIYEYAICNDNYVSQCLYLVKEDNEINMYSNYELYVIEFILEEEGTRIYQLEIEWIDLENICLIPKNNMRKIIKNITKNYGFCNNEYLKKIEKEVLLMTKPSYYISDERKLNNIRKYLVRD